ncbi:ParA family protein [Acidithiobacillus sp. VAN18-1]|uniref:ParA family protein n=1 Tax=Igneacidithiobacillus copahuensis TaxID=2724909 RepID=A0AAE2YQD3_9PROT|nr:ParA family protein [Igneacidithiobacillus copahuensis]MBU2788229.1 ParA family protein [Igneacidithiobacillus copahuensis]MBU2797105.1 ParA family protein [Acidithiobacillus sp. VAN18-2]
MKLFAFANQKGGVGKTTLAVHMAIHAHNMGFRTLLVDLDQQGSATFLATGDGDRHQTMDGTALDLWYPDRKIPVQTSPIFGFDFLQASAGLDAVDDDAAAAVLALRRLDTLEKADEGPGAFYHLVVVDCPPAPGVRQVAPLLIADKHIAPVTPDALGTQGLLSLVQTYTGHIRPDNPKLEFKVLINRVKANSATNLTIASALLEGFPDWVMPHQLYEREDVRKGLRLGKPYWEACRDDAQRDAWYQTFYSLLQDVPDDEDNPDSREVQEPDDAEEILTKQREGGEQ